ncbi:hypothetical protein ACOMHN_008271 [Nucella lapillus]
MGVVSLYCSETVLGVRQFAALENQVLCPLSSPALVDRLGAARHNSLPGHQKGAPDTGHPNTPGAAHHFPGTRREPQTLGTRTRLVLHVTSRAPEGSPRDWAPEHAWCCTSLPGHQKGAPDTGHPNTPGAALGPRPLWCHGQ